MIDSRLLDGMVTFVEVVKSESFTKAAETLGHSTSFISKEVGKLEDRLGVRLLHRTTRKLRLTDEGRLYFDQCRQIVEDALVAENSVTGKQGEPQGLLKVGCSIAFGLAELKSVLPKFTQQYPKVDLELELNDRKVDLVEEGFDVVIRATVQLDDSSLISRQIGWYPTLTLASPGYISKHGKPTHPNDLRHHRVISYSNVKNPHIWVYKDHGGETIQVHVNHQIVTNNSSMEVALALADQGIFRAPSFCLSDEIETGRLVPLFTDLPETLVGVYMVYPSRRHLSTKVRCFLDFMMQELKKAE